MTALQLLADGRRQLHAVQIFVQLFNVSLLFYQHRSCLFAYALYARNVVRAVAHQRFQLDKLYRLKPVILAEFVECVDHRFAVGRKAHGAALADELQAVAVAR